MNLQKRGLELVHWYESTARDLPWRRGSSAYHIWISEIMLQQTRVETVIPYYHRFLEEIPDVTALAFIDEERLLKLWEGLGYYSRCRNLKKAAQLLLKEHGGEMPDTYEAWLKLPGVGPYTAGAIASICFREPVPAIDGNVLRVVARLHGIRENVDRAEGKKKVQDLTVGMMLTNRPGDYNQGLMELGATVCLPSGQPRCDVCPWSNFCMAKKNHWIQEIPAKNKKKDRVVEMKTILLLIADSCVVVKKREEKGLLAGMWEFPNFVGHWTQSEVQNWAKEQGFVFRNMYFIGSNIHRFTHVEWHMVGYRLDLVQPMDRKDWQWVTLEDLEHGYALPSAFEGFRKKLEQ